MGKLLKVAGWYCVFHALLLFCGRSAASAPMLPENPNRNLAASTPPVPPTLSANARSISEIEWSWTLVPDAESYTLYKVTIAGPVPLGTFGPTTTLFVEGGLDENSFHTAFVTASNQFGESGPSNEVSRYTLVQMRNFTLVPGDAQIEISVDPPPNSTADLTGCTIQKTGPTGSPSTTFIELTSVYQHTDRNVENDREYCYKVAWKNGDGIRTEFTSFEKCATPKQQEKTCHKGVVVPGEHRELRNVDGRTTTDPDPEPDCSSKPGVGKEASLYETMDCRHKSGTFGALVRSLGRAALPSGSQESLSGNGATKQLQLTRNPESEEECCDKFSAQGKYHVKFRWVIDRVAVSPNEGRVFVNDPGRPRAVRVRTEWIDCGGVSHFRQRTLQIFLEAEMGWNAAGAVIRDKVDGTMTETWVNDLGGPVEVRKTVITGKATHGVKNIDLEETHPDGLDKRDLFRGKVSGDIAASIRVSGAVSVLAESPRGEVENKRSFAYGDFVARIHPDTHKLADLTEGIVVPDPK